ncbi:hypothetical protein SAMN05216503_1965 [Polaribacter sp. KT25b]|uniref:hypothetical protein n=1 Tax=Polaribacter sp. KT25b TaxID=1855336 RepID=UPI00087AC479|nr:hypothetical protein [Polaribacter sp. KT25b]SDS09582.1 hypothetical protein SAMN05216503_1965 [Polaribacter sp. KT25b]
MKNTILLFTLFTSPLATYTVNAQKHIKKFNFAYIESDYRGTCQGLDVVYFSPVVSYKFDSYDGIIVKGKQEYLQENEMADKWKSKCINHYQFNYDNCMTPNHWVWDKSFNDVDKKRDNMIKDYKNRGYKVYVNHSFGFRLQ